MKFIIDGFAALAEIGLEERLLGLRAKRIPSRKKRELRRKYAKKRSK